MQILVIAGYVLAGILGFIVPMELIYNIRRVIAMGAVFPRSGCFMFISWLFILVDGFFLYSQGTLLTGCIVFLVAAIPGIIGGFSADPNQ